MTSPIADAPSTLPIRVSLAVREFAHGNIALPEAALLAGMEANEFVRLLSTLEWWDSVPDEPPGPEDRPRITAVIPVYNEEESLPVLYERLSGALVELGTYEIVFVDDGSQDRSAAIIAEFQRRDCAVRLLRLSRNFGHQAALSAGIDHARGDAVVLMDADLQDPPEMLPELVARWQDGYQVVYAVRRKRDEGAWKRGTASVFYRVLRAVADVDIPVDAGDFCLMDRRVADTLRRLPERNRFLRGLRSWTGFRQIGVAYERPPRYAGEAKWTLRKMVKFAGDGVMAFTSLPLRLASYLGFLTAAAGMGYLGVAVFAHVFLGGLPKGWTSLVAIVLIASGAQLLVTGVLGAYIARIYEEAKGRPMYVLADEDEARQPQGPPVVVLPR